MATLTPVPTPQTVGTHRPWNTLEILTRSRAILFALTALLLAAILFATQIHRHAVTVVGKDTAPSIVAAQQIKTALAGMDADAADELLDPGSSKSAGHFDQLRIQASEALIEAAKNITFETERDPIETLQVSTGTYERLVQQARDLHDDNQQDMSVRYFRAAGIVMDGTLLPAADDLDKANNDMLEQEYDSQSTRSFVARAIVFLIGIATILALILAQLFFSRRMHRTLNPALFAATIVTAALTFYCFGGMLSEQSHLRAAKEDAFTSVRTLLRARAIADSANADESRYLLDPGHAGEYADDFHRKSAALATLPPSLTDDQLAAQLRSGEKVSGASGLLAEELNNITYPGEREAADETILDYERYVAIDQQIRALEAAGKHDQAVALDVGDQPGQSDYAFSQFDQALGQTLDLNQNEFKQSVDNGFSAIAHLEWEATLTGLLLAILIFFGFAPRIREYQ